MQNIKVARKDGIQLRHTSKDGLDQMKNNSDFNHVSTTVSCALFVFPSICDIYKSVAAKWEACVVQIIAGRQDI